MNKLIIIIIIIIILVILFYFVADKYKMNGGGGSKELTMNDIMTILKYANHIDTVKKLILTNKLAYEAVRSMHYNPVTLKTVKDLKLFASIQTFYIRNFNLDYSDILKHMLKHKKYKNIKIIVNVMPYTSYRKYIDLNDMRISTLQISQRGAYLAQLHNVTLLKKFKNVTIKNVSFDRYDLGKFIDRINLIIPDCVTIIPNYAFNLCNNMKSITFPNSVKYIGKDVFMSCTELRKITLPDDAICETDLTKKQYRIYFI